MEQPLSEPHIWLGEKSSRVPRFNYGLAMECPEKLPSHRSGDDASFNQEAGTSRPHLAIRRSAAEANSRPAGLRLALMTLRILEHWRNYLGVDHHSALIVLATAAITMEKFTRIELDPDLKDIRSEMPPESLTRCNVSSIASATGLNRETARRKVQSLIRAGMLIDDREAGIRLSTEYTRRVQTSDMLRAHIQTLVQTTNGLINEHIISVVASS